MANRSGNERGRLKIIVGNRKSILRPLCVALVVLAASGAHAQYGRGRPTTGATSSPAPLKSLVVTFHGVVKKVSKKEILMESDDHQLLTMRCSKRTKFTAGESDIKPSDVDLESRVAIDASEDNDLKLMALVVRVESAPAKSLSK